LPNDLNGVSIMVANGSFLSSGAKYKGPKEKDTKQKTEEEKTFRRRAKYFLITQFIAVLVFLTLMGSINEGEVEMEDEDGMIVED
jgi:metaxin